MDNATSGEAACNVSQQSLSDKVAIVLVVHTGASKISMGKISMGDFGVQPPFNTLMPCAAQYAAAQYADCGILTGDSYHVLFAYPKLPYPTVLSCSTCDRELD